MASGTIHPFYERISVSVSAGATKSYSYAYNSNGYDRLLVLGHNSNTALRGLYLLGKNVAVTIIEPPNVTVSVSDGTVTISNTAASGSVTGTII